MCVSPRTDTERLLAEVWREVLGRDGFGIHDDFFELGGDSLAAIRAVEMAKAKGVALRPTQFYASPTISGMAAIAEPEGRAPRTMEPREIMHDGAPLDYPAGRRSHCSVRHETPLVLRGPRGGRCLPLLQFGVVPGQ